MQTNTRIIKLLAVCGLVLSFFIQSIIPVRAQQDDQALKPPFTLWLVFDGNQIQSNTPTCVGCGPTWNSRLFYNMGEGIKLAITNEGSVSTTISFPNDKNIKNTFEFNGIYQNGKLTGTWVYNQEDPYIKGVHFGPRTYESSGDIVTTEVIKNDQGAGYASGTISMSNWLQKDQAEIQTYDFKFDWKAKLECECGCDRVDSQARFDSITGAVEVNCDPDEYDWDSATPRTKLFVEDHVSTRQNSSAIIRFADFNTYVLKESTEIVVKSPPAAKSKLSLVLGQLWINTVKILKDGSMEIETSQAVAGIKGTTFVMEHLGDQTTLKVINGTVSFTSKASGASVDVHTGEQATAGPSGLGEIVSFDVSTEQASWLDVADAETLKPSDSVSIVDPDTGSQPAADNSDTAGAENGKRKGLPGLVCGNLALLVGGGGAVVFQRRHKQYEKP